MDTSSCRVIFGEADFLPGLVVDKFADVLVAESLALGIDRLKQTILDLLVKVLAEDGIAIRGVYERSDAKVRLKEGMERVKGFLSEPFDPVVEIVENGIRYQVDVAEGQKTGFFLDQKYNRLAIQPLAKGGRALDCFTHTGAFALNAAKGGAAEVIGVDASQLGWIRPRKTPPSTACPTGCAFCAGMCSSCCPSCTGRGSSLIWWCWIRRPSPSPAPR